MLKVGKNCWRIARAERASVIVDAASYYHIAREAMENARERILIIGWDFDTRISLEPLETGKQETLGAFFLRLTKSATSPRIYILKWALGAKKQFLKPRAVWNLWKWHRTKWIDFKFDGAHPPGCSHHQKICVIDDRFAVCGGIDMATGRWDTPDHLDDEKGRINPDGKRYMPWHDVTLAMEGPIASDLGELGRDRWRIACEQSLSSVERGAETLWPTDLEVQFADVDIAISRTRAEYGDVSEIREIEELWLDMIATTKRFLYVENQYLTSAKIAGAIAKRVQEADPPEFIFIMPRQSDGWLEQRAMDAARVQLARVVGAADTQNRFRIYVPVTNGGEDIYVHAKVAIMDDRILRVGSANLNNRSMGLDSECDVTIDCALPANAGQETAIASLRVKLLVEHLGVTAEAFQSAFSDTGSIVESIERLKGSAKTLELLDLVRPNSFDQFIAENELLDPEHPDKFLEPISERSIWKNWAKGWKSRRGRAAKNL